MLIKTISARVEFEYTAIYFEARNRSPVLRALCSTLSRKQALFMQMCCTKLIYAAPVNLHPDADVHAPVSSLAAAINEGYILTRHE